MIILCSFYFCSSKYCFVSFYLSLFLVDLKPNFPRPISQPAACHFVPFLHNPIKLLPTCMVLTQIFLFPLALKNSYLTLKFSTPTTLPPVGRSLSPPITMLPLAWPITIKLQGTTIIQRISEFIQKHCTWRSREGFKKKRRFWKTKRRGKGNLFEKEKKGTMHFEEEKRSTRA